MSRGMAGVKAEGFHGTDDYLRERLSNSRDVGMRIAPGGCWWIEHELVHCRARRQRSPHHRNESRARPVQREDGTRVSRFRKRLSDAPSAAIASYALLRGRGGSGSPRPPTLVEIIERGFEPFKVGVVARVGEHVLDEPRHPPPIGQGDDEISAGRGGRPGRSANPPGVCGAVSSEPVLPDFEDGARR
jgi:hypothetical protein